MRWGLEFCSQNKDSGEWSDGSGTYWKQYDPDDVEDGFSGASHSPSNPQASDVVDNWLPDKRKLREKKKRRSGRAKFQTDREYAIHGYFGQKGRARSRGVEWRFSFQEWLDFWGDDLRKRGLGPGKLSMARVMDQGPYADWNVFKADSIENCRRIAMYPKKFDLVLD